MVNREQSPDAHRILGTSFEMKYLRTPADRASRWCKPGRGAGEGVLLITPGAKSLLPERGAAELDFTANEEPEDSQVGGPWKAVLLHLE